MVAALMADVHYSTWSVSAAGIVAPSSSSVRAATAAKPTARSRAVATAGVEPSGALSCANDGPPKAVPIVLTVIAGVEIASARGSKLPRKLNLRL